MSVVEGVHQKKLEEKDDEIGELQTQLRMKEREFSQTGRASKDVMNVRVAALASELAHKDRKIREIEAGSMTKDNTIQQFEAAKNEMQLKLRGVVKAAETNRKACAEERKAMSDNSYQAHLNHKYSLQAQADAIVRLTSDNRRLELEKTVLSMTASQHQQRGFSSLRDTVLHTVQQHDSGKVGGVDSDNKLDFVEMFLGGRRQRHNITCRHGRGVQLAAGSLVHLKIPRSRSFQHLETWTSRLAKGW
ncbi:uncharacterized protein M421DRAFT_88796 [Didymella exigua CBS 183.55]|uniref:Uncharacterized protein n=1 Tax=Didymella exigua CBS 183.55 TaxID=1150837 RepID=A0A6A5S558_9PLEO|nr:uncharacterized protein M421DRAFT_88796 [Didymella exigua CBS 183.55]KAF1933626.1 hypothetical protein M421DRAFT_88796 [Didymella exigua CBS 183.55]